MKQAEKTDFPLVSRLVMLLCWCCAGGSHSDRIGATAGRLCWQQSGRHPGTGSGGRWSVEELARPGRGTAHDTGWRQRLLPLHADGPWPTVVDGRHHPTDEHSGKTKVGLYVVLWWSDTQENQGKTGCHHLTDEYPGKNQGETVNNWTLREKEHEKVWQPTGEHSGRKQTQNKILWRHPADKHPVEGRGWGCLWCNGNSSLYKRWLLMCGLPSLIKECGMG